jgi:hypothetical protein
MELLGDLVVDRQHWVGLGVSSPRMSNSSTMSPAMFRLFGAVDLIVAELEPHCEPVPTPVCEPDEEGQHRPPARQSVAGLRAAQPCQ